MNTTPDTGEAIAATEAVGRVTDTKFEDASSTLAVMGVVTLHHGGSPDVASF